MATLDDKLLGEKLHYYCSSSEDEDEGSKSAGPPQFVPEGELSQWDGASANTGPKGVIKDWQRYKQLERENRQEKETEMMALAQKLSLTCRTHAEDEKADAAEGQVDEDLEALLDDEFLQQYMERRMRQMLLDQSHARQKEFGSLVALTNGAEFLDAIDNEDKRVIVVVCIYEDNAPGCSAMLGCLRNLAPDHKHVKFCQILATSAGLSKHFESSGIPALLVYQGGDIMTNFVRVTDTLGEDFYVSDVESLLIEHGVLSNEDPTPSIIKEAQPTADDSD